MTPPDCPWFTPGDIIAAIVGIGGWIFGGWQWGINRRENRADKTIDHLGDSWKTLEVLKTDTGRLIALLTQHLGRGETTSPESAELRVAAATSFFKLYDVLEVICSMVDLGVIDEKVVIEDIVPILKPYAEAQIKWYRILKEISRRGGHPFDTAQSSKTYQKFYRVIRKYLPLQERLKLNAARKECGLPSVFVDIDAPPQS